MLKFIVLPFILFLVSPVHVLNSGLQEKLQQIDDEFSGDVGVYIKNLEDGQIVNHNGDQRWYLASTTKIPVAIAILKKVEDGELSLDDELTLQDSDKVDGAGDMHWQDAGSVYTIRTLLEKMMKDSDSTATDMLIRYIGEEELNQFIQDELVSEGIERITTILQVRYEAYGELHENAENLTNLDIIRLRGISNMSERLDELVRIMDVDRDELNAENIVDAFYKYYDGGLNSGTMEAMSVMLERLVEGEYLNEENTDLLIEIMEVIATGDHRIKAGLPEGIRFAQKTGTLIGRACNVGVIYPQQDQKPIVVSVCAKDYNQLSDAENAFQRIGMVISENWL
ncbi:serine hydrolase [Rhodohalobacter sp. SW132]|uniref:serine hydrolase n=1 Tax=Rhodohalobacter sp. SW132 TaxID=2293433 RepID=UPI000E282BC7|nr:serine hydrolase [Rhodohalobacter sp. SW132]REL39175.1 serine hydrolase [Rhodohalobacter sp. SW132]